MDHEDANPLAVRLPAMNALDPIATSLVHDCVIRLGPRDPIRLEPPKATGAKATYRRRAQRAQAPRASVQAGPLQLPAPTSTEPALALALAAEETQAKSVPVWLLR